MLYNGAGVQKDVKKALNALHGACDQGEAQACNRLASLYLRGSTEVPRSVRKAHSVLEQACDGNFAPACHNLAVMYKRGEEGIPQYV